jgi:thiamine-phosphate pyrophosphorylase
VAIGGITPGRAAEVIAAGADAVAVISALLPPAGQPARRESVAETVRDFLAHLR